jgi:ubiquinone/menaquinone biosynthesis C-methylase UbiE
MDLSIVEINPEQKSIERTYPSIQRYCRRFIELCLKMVKSLSKFRQIVVKVSKVKPDAKILDIGSGIGKQAFAFGDKGYDVTGIDLIEGKIKKASERRHSNLNFRVADATSMPFADNQFDVSYASFVFHEIPGKVRERILQEMLRVTKPRGLIMIVDYSSPINWIGKCLSYLFKYCEGSYYAEYIQTDLAGVLSRMKLGVVEEHSILFGSGRIIKAINQKTVQTLSFRGEVIGRQKDEKREFVFVR